MHFEDSHYNRVACGHVAFPSITFLSFENGDWNMVWVGNIQDLQNCKDFLNSSCNIILKFLNGT
jgi:hypothetical protein